LARERGLTAGADAAMFVFGIVMALVGAVLPVISQQIRFDLAQAGNLFLVMNCCMLASMLGLGVVTDRIGHKPVLIGGALCVSAALAVLVQTRTYGTLLASVALLGAGGGALNGASNTLIADLHTEPRRKAAALNLLGVFFGFGALFLPFTVGALLDAIGLRPILWIAVVLSVVPAAVFLVPAFPPAKQKSGMPPGAVAKLARNPVVLTIAILLFFESGNEFILGGYVSTYLVREAGISVSAASYVLAGYWAALMLTRVVSSRLLLRMKGATLVTLSAAVVMAAVALLIGGPTAAIRGLGAVLAGAGCAAIYPTMLGEAGSRFAEYSGTAFGIIFAIAMIGGITMPWAAGQIASAYGLRAALALPLAGAFMIILIRMRLRQE
jgi:FHS family glucose/mannose:H+ symporter-like MFS transporter